MKTNCLITKLDGTVNNPNLKILDTCPITLDGGESSKIFQIRADGATARIISGEAYFTDSTGEADYGTERTNLTASFYVKATGKCVVLLDNLHKLDNVLSTSFENNNNPNIRSNISYDIIQLLQSNPELNLFSPGYGSATTLGMGDACTGDVTNLTINAKTIGLGGCNRLTGSMNNIVDNLPTNAVALSFYATYLTFDLEHLAGHPNLKVYTSNTYTKGNIKWYGETANHTIICSVAGSNAYTGSIEELVRQLISAGRTGSEDYFGLQVKYSAAGSNMFTGVTYQGEYLPYYFTHDNPNNYLYIRFTWDSEGNITHTMQQSGVSI